MAKALTDIAIANLKPGPARYEKPDAGARGLRVIIQPSGRKSFAVRYRNAAGRARKLTLPGGITLAAARKLAADALLELAQGKDPGTAKQDARRGARSRVDARRWPNAWSKRPGRIRRSTRSNGGTSRIRCGTGAQ